MKQLRLAVAAIVVCPQKLRRVLRTVVERRQQQVELPLLSRIDSMRNPEVAERPGQRLRSGGERMRAWPRLRRTTPAGPRSAPWKSGVFSPHAQLRLARPGAVESNHADILTGRSDAAPPMQ